MSLPAVEGLNGATPTPPNRPDLRPVGTPTSREPSSWLRSGPDLFSDRERPVAWLIEGLIGDQALGALQGAAKVGKSWAIGELALAIVTGTPAYGAYPVKRRGPVIVVFEESPQADTSRRLSELARGRGLRQADPDVAGLHVASNQGVRLNSTEWRANVERAVAEIKPVAVFFDPLVRIKGSIDENEQGELQGLLGWLSDLRTRHGCAVIFAHHTGHGDKDRMRGSSDLEAWWSSKVEIRIKDNRQEIRARHREAEDTQWSPITRQRPHGSASVLLTVNTTPSPGDPASSLPARILAHFTAADTGDGLTRQQVEQAVEGRAQSIRDALDTLHAQGQIEPHGRRLRLAGPALPGVVPEAGRLDSSRKADDRDDEPQNYSIQGAKQSSHTPDDTGQGQSSRHPLPKGGDEDEEQDGLVVDPTEWAKHYTADGRAPQHPNGDRA